jgi:hypothetical protein
VLHLWHLLKTIDFSIGLGGYRYYNVISYLKKPYTEVAFSYNHKFKNGMGLFASANPLINNLAGGLGFEILTREGSIWDADAIGKIETRTNYWFFDLGFSFQKEIIPKHNVSVKIGPSLAEGHNTYFTSIVFAPSWPNGLGDIIDAKQKIIREAYWGAVLGLAYDYRFYKKMNIGAALNYRYYVDNFPRSLHYNLHLGYNF